MLSLTYVVASIEFIEKESGDQNEHRHQALTMLSC